MVRIRYPLSLRLDRHSGVAPRQGDVREPEGARAEARAAAAAGGAAEERSYVCSNSKLECIFLISMCFQV